MNENTRLLASAGTAMAAAFGSALCCAGPSVAVAVGASAAGLAVLLPFRPLLVLLAVGALYYAFHLLDKDEKACQLGRPCADPLVRRRMRFTVWMATGVVLVFGTSPIWIRWIL
jgi:mercuric ion transport protein